MSIDRLRYTIPIILVMLLLAACGGSSTSQTKPTLAPTPTPGVGQQLLAKTGQKLHAAKTLHGTLNTTIDGQAFNGILQIEVWNATPDKNRAVVAKSNVPEFPTGSIIVTNGKQLWQYDPAKKVVYSGPATNNDGTSAIGTGLSGGGGQGQLILNLVQTIFTHSNATLVSSLANVNGHDTYELHVVSRDSASAASTPGTTAGTGNFAYEGEVYIDKATELPLKLDLAIAEIGHVILDLPDLILNQSIPDSLFNYVPPVGVKVLPLQQQSSTPGTSAITLAQAEQQAGYHLLRIPGSQEGYQLQGVDALGSPGNQIYTLNYAKGNTNFTISEGKPLANLPGDTGQQVSLRGTTATLSTSNGSMTLAWTENGVGIRITGPLSNDAIVAIAKLLT